MRYRLPLLLSTLAVLWPATTPAQSQDRAYEQGIRAYRALEMESAGWLLRQSLANDRLDPQERRTALSYLGAAEFYRDRRDSALAAYARLIRLDPHYEVDHLVFGPDVQTLFDEARRQTPIVEVTATRTSFTPGGRGLPVRLRTNTPHVVVVTAETINGDVMDTVFRKRVRDTATAYWAANPHPGERPPVGGYVLAVSSLDTQDQVKWRVTVPVHVTRAAENPLDVPPPPVMLPEHRSLGPGLARLGLGLAAATTAYFATPLVTDSKGWQLALTEGFAAAGVIGFFGARPGAPLPDNVVANRVAREAWEARVAQVQAENRRRTDGGTVYVDVGEVSGSSAPGTR
jgi:hypothetical protein